MRLFKYILKISFGVIVALAVWGVLLVAVDRVFDLVMPNWYVSEGAAIDDALNRKNIPYQPSNSFLSVQIFATAFITLFSGWIAAFVSRKRFIPPYLFGMCMVVLQFIGFYYTPLIFPVWYKFLAVVMLVPLAVLGGKLRKR